MSCASHEEQPSEGLQISDVDQRSQIESFPVDAAEVAGGMSIATLARISQAAPSSRVSISQGASMNENPDEVLRRDALPHHGLGNYLIGRSMTDGDASKIQHTGTVQLPAQPTRLTTKITASTAAWFKDDHSCGLWPRTSQPRRSALVLTETWWFDYIVTIAIVLNSLVLAIFFDPLLLRVVQAGADLAPFLEGNIVAKMNLPLKLSACQGADLDVMPVQLCTPLGLVEFAFLLLFTLEMLIKLLAFGVVGHKDAYFRSAWNWLDAVVVFTGWLEMLSDLGIASLRVLRVLRPLRVSHRVPGMKALIQALATALPECANALLLLLLVLGTFAIVGLQAFHGALRHGCHALSDDGTEWVATGDTCNPRCTRHEVTQQLVGVCASLGNRTLGKEGGIRGYTCRPAQGGFAAERCLCSNSGDDDATCAFSDNPSNGAVSFDNWAVALITFLQIVSMEGWSDVMYSLMDAVGPGAVVYFICGILFGGFFVASLFLAVLSESFATAQQAGRKDGAEHDSKVREVIAGLHSEASAAVGNPADGTSEGLGAATSGGCTQGWCSAVVRLCRAIDGSVWLERAVMAAIAINIIELALWWCPQHPLAEQRSTAYIEPVRFWVLISCQVTLNLFFVIEICIKLVARGPRGFASDWFDLADIVIIPVSIAAVIGRILTTDSALAWLVALGGSLRAIRGFRLLRSFELVSAMVGTLAASASSIFDLAVLVLLFMYIFALLGMELFGGDFARPDHNYTMQTVPKVFEERGIVDDGDDISRTNFDSFGEAIVSVFIVISGENWNDVLSANAARSPALACLYFALLYLFGTLILFNLFVAILLSNLEEGAAARHEIRVTLPPPPEQEGIELTGDAGGHKMQRGGHEGNRGGEHGGHASATARMLARKSDRDTDPAMEDGDGGRLHGMTSPEPLSTELLGIVPFASMKHSTKFRDNGKVARLSYLQHLTLRAPSLQLKGSPVGLLGVPWTHNASPTIGRARVSQASPGGGAAADGELHEVTTGFSTIDASSMDPTVGTARPESTGQPLLQTYGARSSGLEDDLGQPRVVAVGLNSAALGSSGAAPLRRGACTRVRDLSAVLVHHGVFESSVILIIFLSSAQLAVDWPGYEAGSAPRSALDALAITFASLFAFEALLRMLGNGLLLPRLEGVQAYLRDPWCIFDLIVLLFSIVSIIVDSVDKVFADDGNSSQFGAIRALRALRALRPLRMLPHFPGIRRMVGALLAALPAVAALGLIALLAILIFAIMGMGLFGGKMGYCLDPRYTDLQYGSRVIPGAAPDPADPSLLVMDYFECMSLSRYNLTRVNSFGVPLTSLPADEYATYYSYPQWVQLKAG